MKNLLQNLFTYSLVLFALSVASPVFAQDGTPSDGPPTVRKETTDGESGLFHGCHLINNGNNQNLNITVFYTDPSYYLNCNLQIGYQLMGQPYTYVPVDITYENGIFSDQMTIPFTAEEIAWRCQNDMFEFSIDLYCLVDKKFQALPPSPSTDNTLKICCDPDDIATDPTGSEGHQNDNSGTGNGGLIDNSDIDNIEFGIVKNSGANISVDYFLYDIHGNHIKTLKNASLSNNVQELISDLSIRSGIYFIRYLDHNEIKIKKVFKY